MFPISLELGLLILFVFRKLEVIAYLKSYSTNNFPKYQ